MKLAFVVQRYGEDVIGGSERLCRLVADHLSRYHQIEVITSCAKDYVTWNNEYPEGTEQLNGVTVRRFRNELRDHERFGRLTERLLKSHSREEELDWMRAQGPYSVDLLTFLKRNRSEYDLFVFFTYLYCTTFYGLPLVSDRSVIIPTAHDEFWISLSIFDDLFRLPKGFMYLTEEEKRFVQKRFHNNDAPSAVVGIGIDPPNNPEPNRFRKKHEIGEPFLIYRGRVDPSKGCLDLVRYFQEYKKRTVSDLKLVFDGPLLMQVPKEHDIAYVGVLDQIETFDALAASDITVLPSKLESLSLSTLEGWQLGKPALVNGQSTVLKGHCIRSNAGLYYRNCDEFVECLDLLTTDNVLARQLGENGRRYVTEEYSWRNVERKYLSFLDRMARRV